MINGVPKLHSKEYRIIFHHHVTNDLLKYKFKSLAYAEDFFSKLDSKTSTMYVIERIR